MIVVVVIVVVTVALCNLENVLSGVGRAQEGGHRGNSHFVVNICFNRLAEIDQVMDVGALHERSQVGTCALPRQRDVCVRTTLELSPCISLLRFFATFIDP